MTSQILVKICESERAGGGLHVRRFEWHNIENDFFKGGMGWNGLELVGAPVDPGTSNIQRISPDLEKPIPELKIPSRDCGSSIPTFRSLSFPFLPPSVEIYNMGVKFKWRTRIQAVETAERKIKRIETPG